MGTWGRRECSREVREDGKGYKEAASEAGEDQG